jgi:hypothetical protein
MSARKNTALLQARRGGPNQSPTAVPRGAWSVFVAHCHQHSLVKTKCDGAHGEKFGGLPSLEKARFEIDEVLLLKGELVRDHLRPKVQNRKGADCVFFLRFNDGTVRVVVVELKTGHDESEHFQLQLWHSREDSLALAKKTGIAQVAEHFYGAPRLPDTVRKRDKAFKKRFEDRFEVAKTLAELLDAMPTFQDKVNP